MICQRTTRVVVYSSTQSGFTADVYLDDFHGADKALLAKLGLKWSPEKDSPPSTRKVCLGVKVDSDAFPLSVPQTRLEELVTELEDWCSRSSYIRKRLKSLLGKLSFVTPCVKPGLIFMSRLLNALRTFPSKLFQATDFTSYEIRHYVVDRVSSDF